MSTSLIELGIDFVPVPGVKAAFDVLVFIWQNVQKASHNKEILRNLAISASDILTAVNHVLEEHDPTRHMRAMLDKLELILIDICLFAAEHANMNLFKLLMRNVDVDGQIEFFQSRLQNLWVAFNIVALGSIGSEVHLIHKGLPGVKKEISAKDVSPIHSPTAHVAPRKSSLQLNEAHPPPMPHGTNLKTSRSQNSREISDKPALVGASSSIPYNIEVRNNAPFLNSRYNSEEHFDHWGFKPETQVKRKLNEFEIFRSKDSKSWTWTLRGKVVSISRRNQKHPSWQDSMDLAFCDCDSAASWFSWLEAYASSPQSVKTLQDPPASELTLRKKTSHSKMRKSATTIEYKRPTRKTWSAILRGHAKSARDHASQLTYISSASYGKLPFCTLYRSGDTLVYERFIRADSLEPIISRRYRFDTVNLARTWYTLWRDCAMETKADEEFVQVELVTNYDCKILFENNDILLTSKVWSDIDLRKWGTPSFKRTEPFEAITFNWKYKQGDKITVNAVIDSRPDWFDTLEIEFRDTKSASAWYTYLTGSDATTQSPAPPHKENVTVTTSSVCWVRNHKDSMETRTATSGKWAPVFGKSYTKFASHGSHLSVVSSSSSVVPILRIWTNGSTLHLDRRRAAEEQDGVVSRKYIFDSSAEAETWYDIWRKRLEQLSAETQ